MFYHKHNYKFKLYPCIQCPGVQCYMFYFGWCKQNSEIADGGVQTGNTYISGWLCIPRIGANLQRLTPCFQDTEFQWRYCSLLYFAMQADNRNRRWRVENRKYLNLSLQISKWVVSTNYLFLQIIHSLLTHINYISQHNAVTTSDESGSYHIMLKWYSRWYSVTNKSCSYPGNLIWLWNMVVTALCGNVRYHFNWMLFFSL